jgi:hypothetical protein
MSWYFLYAALVAGMQGGTARTASPTTNYTRAEREAMTLRGRWTMSRDGFERFGKTPHCHVDLEFSDGKLKIETDDDIGDLPALPVFDVKRLESSEGANRIVLALPGQKERSVVYYDLRAGKLILVGRCPVIDTVGRFHLAGEYKRVEKAK